jgi:hypothetical protein
LIWLNAPAVGRAQHALYFMEAAMPAKPNAHVEYPLVDTAITALADWINRYRQSAQPSGLGECDAREVARIATDLGISTGDLRSLAKAEPGSAKLLGYMLTALGIDPKGLARTEPLVMRDLERLCTTCPDKKRCRHDLEEFSAAQHFHDYCPNAVTLDALVAERGNQANHPV